MRLVPLSSDGLQPIMQLAQLTQSTREEDGCESGTESNTKHVHVAGKASQHEKHRSERQTHESSAEREVHPFRRRDGCITHRLQRAGEPERTAR